MGLSRVAVAALLIALTGPAAGCGADDGATHAEPSETAGRCSTPTGGEELVLEPASDVRLPAAVYDGGGATALVLLHQTNRDGRCGWDPFAQAAAERGLTSLAFDMCGWGDSICPEEWSTRTSEQVQHAVDYARSELGLSRVVVVGASMGAARTVFAMADGADADAWVYVSGPPVWDGRVVADEARRIDVPGLVIHDPDDGDAEFAASRVTARNAGAAFVRGRGGHGYDVVTNVDGSLTRLGERVLEFASGR